jgi:putative transposase
VIHVRQKLDTSERRTCKVVGLARSSLQYKAAPKDDDALRLAMIRLAKQYGRYGYRKVAKLLRIEGWHVNHKKIKRLWQEEGLQLPHRHRKRKRLCHKDSSIIRLRPTHPNHVWSIDFVHDKLSNGRPYKILTVLDEYTRQHPTHCKRSTPATQALSAQTDTRKQLAGESPDDSARRHRRS